jgi:hypothetical protein
LLNVGPYIYDVKISGFTRSSIYIYSLYIYIYDISRLRVKLCSVSESIVTALGVGNYLEFLALASITIRLQASRSLALSLHSFILRSVDTSSSHLVFGLPLRLVAYRFPYTFLGTAVSCNLEF